MSNIEMTKNFKTKHCKSATDPQLDISTCTFLCPANYELISTIRISHYQIEKTSLHSKPSQLEKECDFTASSHQRSPRSTNEYVLIVCVGNLGLSHSLFIISQP